MKIARLPPNLVRVTYCYHYAASKLPPWGSSFRSLNFDEHPTLCRGRFTHLKVVRCMETRFDIEQGIKQGDIFAPMFFNAALGSLSGRLHLESESNHRNCSFTSAVHAMKISSKAKVQPFSKILPIHCGPSAVH